MTYDSSRLQKFAGVPMPILDSFCNVRSLNPVIRKFKEMGYEVHWSKHWDTYEVSIWNGDKYELSNASPSRFEATYLAIISLLDKLDSAERSKVYQEQLNEPYH